MSENNSTFLNTKGGKLFIGVADKVGKNGKREIFGVNQSESFSRDRYKLDLLNHLEKTFTQNYVSKYINVEFVSIGKPCVCVVDVQAITNDLPALVTFENKQETLFVRLDNKTVQKTSPKDLILFGRDFWTRNDKLNPSPKPNPAVPAGWEGPFKLISVEPDENQKIVSLHVAERAKPIVCNLPTNSL